MLEAQLESIENQKNVGNFGQIGQIKADKNEPKVEIIEDIIMQNEQIGEKESS